MYVSNYEGKVDINPCQVKHQSNLQSTQTLSLIMLISDMFNIASYRTNLFLKNTSTQVQEH